MKKRPRRERDTNLRALAAAQKAVEEHLCAYRFQCSACAWSGELQLAEPIWSWDEARPLTHIVCPDCGSQAQPEKNPAAVALGRLGGRKGGLARAAGLSPERRGEIARNAAVARWAKSKRG